MPSSFETVLLFSKYYITINHITLIKHSIMVKFEVNGKAGDVIVNLPESIKELTPEYLKGVTSEINVADNYTLIALCHKEKLSSFVMAVRNKQNQINTAVIPLFVKRGIITTSNTLEKAGYSFINTITIGDKLLISPTAMSLGLHVNVPMNNLAMGHFLNIIDGDVNIYQKALQINKSVIFVEYKLIPNSDIIGAYSEDKINFDNPFTFANKKALDTAEGN